MRLLNTNAAMIFLLLAQACGKSEFKDSQTGNVKHSQDAGGTTVTTPTDPNPDPEINTKDGGGTTKIKKVVPTIAECTSKDTIIDEETTIDLEFAKANPKETYSILLEDKSVGVDMGTVTTSATVGKVVYRAPKISKDASSKDTFVYVKADSSGADEAKYCRIGIARAGSLGIDFGASGRLRLPVAQVYKLKTKTRALPDFSKFSPVQTIKFKDINVPGRDFTLGFPGVANLLEDFGIQFKFTLVVPVAGLYEFAISSDDGSRLYINGAVVTVLDGLAYSSRAAYGYGKVTLAAGNAVGQVDYFQGPGNVLGMVLLWKKPGDTAFVPVPPSAFAP